MTRFVPAPPIQSPEFVGRREGTGDQVRNACVLKGGNDFPQEIRCAHSSGSRISESRRVRTYSRMASPSV
jgi:hypothetical protein